MVTAPVNDPDRESWTEVLPEQQDVPLDSFDLFQDFAVASETVGGLDRLRVFTFKNDVLQTGDETDGSAEPSLGIKTVTFPEPAYSAGLSANRDFETQSFRYSYTSLVTPASVYEYEVKSGKSTLLKQQEVPGGFDREKYASERLWVAAPDGVKVPVSLVYRRDSFRKDGTNPIHLYGYGSYGYALPIGFSATRLALLDRGFVLAYAHIRGGGDLGDAWHDAGKMMEKRNTFTDFIAAAEALVSRSMARRTRS